MLQTLMDKILVGMHARRVAATARRNNAQIHQNGSKGTLTGNVDLRYPEHVHIGARSYVNGGMLAASENAHIVIGRDCMLSYGVHLRTDMHGHKRFDIPMNQQGNTEQDIIIGDDVWVGYGAQIMSGVTVGSHSIIGSGAVVTHDVPEYAVMGGGFLHA